MKIYCPTCDHDYLTIYSRKKYFIKLGACLVIPVFFYFASDELKNVLPAFWGGLLVSCLSIIAAAYYLIKGILKKEATYKCGYCKSENLASSLTPDQHAAIHILLNTL
jgi:hypothetical protein